MGETRGGTSPTTRHAPSIIQHTPRAIHHTTHAIHHPSYNTRHTAHAIHHTTHNTPCHVTTRHAVILVLTQGVSRLSLVSLTFCVRCICVCNLFLSLSLSLVYPLQVDPGATHGDTVIDVADLTLTTGEHVSPLVWSPFLTSPAGDPLKDVGLRVVNRTDFYRCHEPY